MIESLCYSPSAVDTFVACKARHWFGKHDDDAGKLACNDAAAKASVAVHDVMMRLGRESVVRHKRGDVPAIPDAAQRRRMVGEALFKNQVDATAPAISQRLALAEVGLGLAVERIVREAPEWVCDPVTGNPLVWHEQWLDSGPRYTGVIIAEGVVSRTRADTIGIRMSEDGTPRIVIRDHKTKRDPVDPRFDNGILIRAIWAAGEIENPRCPWFLRGRGITVDPEVIELETVNLLHGSSDDFIIRTECSISELHLHRVRLAELMAEMAAVESLEDATLVAASPSALCKDYCPFLHRCSAGQEFVAGSYGNDVVDARLGTAPLPQPWMRQSVPVMAITSEGL